MNTLISSLFIIPAVVSGLILILPKLISRIVIISVAFTLSGISIYLFVSIHEPYHLGVPKYFDQIVAVADIILLVFFAWIAVRRKSLLVGAMSVLQLGALLYVTNDHTVESSLQFMVDKLTLFMFLLINIISSIICIFSLKYIDEEDCNNFRKKYFLSILFWFIAVMNVIVCCDNLEYFFLFFELTTLASFLLIGFRKDETSTRNALTALWMNQIGGLAILAAIFFINYNGYGEGTFSNLLQHASSNTILLPVALLSIAALIKGAQMPFSKWLLGAMVAPTPVSALLHSSTMVKLAPFIILRLSPVLKETSVAWVIVALTGFVFVASAIAALSQDNFKRILAHSTISLLALMIMMAAIGTPATALAAITLILFHGLSKCMLFLDAGIMERVFHVKETSDMDRLGERGPFAAFVITVGFMSLLLPPFGAFIGKWFSIETLGALAVNERVLGAVVIVMIAFGGAVLSLLYFKVLGLSIARAGDKDKVEFETQSAFYFKPILVLLGLIIGGALTFPFLMMHCFAPVASQALHVPVGITTSGWSLYVGSMVLPVVPLMLAFLLLPATIVLAMFIRFKNVDRAKEYACGEKIDYSFSALYFSTDKATPYFTAIGILFFVALIAVVVL
ncbi:MAG TPA: proton-conducting transporter membrane subunit [Parafilimonas sp.]|nr:proton-conducting transporter membrane subunit [Parafilimonas sp.]